jgi:hypothetical protein
VKTTAVHCPPFYDEQGRLHHHDTNRQTRSFRCSNGHSWVEVEPQTCWCGWTTEFQDEEPPTTREGRARPASIPDVIFASSPDEEPPAGFEVGSKEPLTFTRIPVKK